MCKVWGSSYSRTTALLLLWEHVFFSWGNFQKAGKSVKMLSSSAFTHWTQWTAVLPSIYHICCWHKQKLLFLSVRHHLHQNTGELCYVSHWHLGLNCSTKHVFEGERNIFPGHRWLFLLGYELQYNFPDNVDEVGLQHQTLALLFTQRYHLLWFKTGRLIVTSEQNIQ